MKDRIAKFRQKLLEERPKLLYTFDLAAAAAAGSIITYVIVKHDSQRELVEALNKVGRDFLPLSDELIDALESGSTNFIRFTSSLSDRVYHVSLEQ